MNLVDPEVHRQKVERELALWDANAASYSRRGWIMLRREPPLVDVGFLARLAVGPQAITSMPACIQVDFTSYDLWAPSVEFIDPFTRTYAAPVVQALVEIEGGAQNLIVGGHPETGRPFLCVPGVRQYHSHPQHTGDSWLLHRPAHGGSLVMICEQVWQTMVRTLLGVQFQVLSIPGGLQANFQLVSAPGEQASLMWAQAEQHGAGHPTPPGPPAQVLAALGIAHQAAPAGMEDGGAE